MPESIRDLIIADVIARLREITVANGFGVDTRRVDRGERSPHSLRELPAIVVLEPSDTAESGPVGPRNWTDVRMRIIVQGWMSKDAAVVDQGDYGRDIVTKLMENPRRGTHPVSGEDLAITTEYVGQQPIFYVDQAARWQGVLVMFEIVYRHRVEDPTTV